MKTSTPTSTWNHCFVVTEANSGKVYCYADVHKCRFTYKVIAAMLVDVANGTNVATMYLVLKYSKTFFKASDVYVL
jgi:hypothetical protein